MIDGIITINEIIVAFPRRESVGPCKDLSESRKVCSVLNSLYFQHKKWSSILSREEVKLHNIKQIAISLTAILIWFKFSGSYNFCSAIFVVTERNIKIMLMWPVVCPGLYQTPNQKNQTKHLCRTTVFHYYAVISDFTSIIIAALLCQNLLFYMDLFTACPQVNLSSKTHICFSKTKPRPKMPTSVTPCSSLRHTNYSPHSLFHLPKETETVKVRECLLLTVFSSFQPIFKLPRLYSQ